MASILLSPAPSSRLSLSTPSTLSPSSSREFHSFDGKFRTLKWGQSNRRTRRVFPKLSLDQVSVIDPPPSLPVSESSELVSSLKLKLLSVVSGLNRGLAASEDDLRRADEAAKELEATARSVDLFADLDKLQGRWKLIYSSAFSSRTLGGSRPGPPTGRLLPITLGQVFLIMKDDHHACSGEKKNELGSTGTENTKKKQSRGPSRLEKLEGKGPFSLEWDKVGCPTGQFATSFASYCGKRVRCQVNINFDDWDKDVEVGLKNLLWEDISKKYLINERHKEHVLLSCGRKWRDFKTKLTTRWIRNKHPKYDSPAHYYSYIEHVDWEKFKASRETEEFKEKSKKATKSIKHNEHPHLMGRRGYNQRIPEWVADSSISSSSPVSCSSLVTDRSWRWIKARSKSDGEVPNEKTKKIAEQMLEWRKKVDSGEFVPDRYDDVLSRSLDKKEHPGRVRGFGGGVTIKDVFGTSHRTSQRSVGISEQEVAKITERVRTKITDEVRKDTVEFLGDLIRQQSVGVLKRMGLQVPANLDKPLGSCQSVDPKRRSGMSQETHPTCDPAKSKEPTKCRLACVHDGATFIVAVGTVFPSGDSTEVHGTPLLVGNMKVSVDDVLEGKAPQPVPTNYFERVGDAVGSFVQWPKELIMIEEESPFGNTSIANNGKQMSKGSGIIEPPSECKFDEYTSSIGPKSKELRDSLALMPSEANKFEVVLPSSLFHFKADKTLYVTGEHINPLFQMSFLNVSCIQVFIM